MHHVKDRVSVSGVGRQCRVHSTLSYILKKQRMYREKTDFVCLLCVSANECFLFFLSLRTLYKGGVPAAPSGTATLLRLSLSYRFYPRTLLAGGVLQVPPASMA